MTLPNFYRLFAMLFLLHLLVGLTDSQAQAIRQDWKREMPVYPPANQFGARAGIDLDGNAYWAVNNEDSTSGFHYVYLQKIDTFNNPLWSVYIGGVDGAEITDLKTDISGNTYLYGTDFGAGANQLNTPFINKYNSDGTLLWSLYFDFDLNGVEVPDQIFICPNGDIIATASENSPQLTMPVARYSPAGDLIWQTSFGGYEAGDILVDKNDFIHLATTYHLGPNKEDEHFAYLLLNGSGSITNTFIQSGGEYSHALHTGGKGRTVGIDVAGNFYCVSWVFSFPKQDTAWTNTMVYKFDALGNQIWSKRLEVVLLGYPGSHSVLLTDYLTGELALIGGKGLWRYETDGTSIGGWYDRRRTFVDGTMFNREFTFTLSAGIPDNNDSGKITHFTWGNNDTAFYKHGRGSIQNLNETAIVEQDSSHVALYVTWAYNGKASIHRLVLRDTVITSVDENFTNSGDAFSLYPNPATEIVTISFGDQFNDAISIQVIDVIGRTIMEKSFSNPRQVELPVNELHSGMYQVMITSGNNQYSRKLVIQ